MKIPILLLCDFLIILLADRFASAEGEPFPEPILGDFFKFHSDPELLSPRPIVKHITTVSSLLDPGYIFVTPGGLFEQDFWYSFGPHIYDNHGDLVWNGREQVNWFSSPWGIKKMRSMNFRPCNIGGPFDRILCWTDTPQEAVIEGKDTIAKNRLFSSSYEAVTRDFNSINEAHDQDPHDFLTTKTSLIQLLSRRRPRDLSGWQGPVAGWIKDCCFEDIDLWTRNSNLYWCLSDAVDLDDTQVYMRVPENVEQGLNTTAKWAGKGTETAVWDYAHLNALTLTYEGNYIISIRHFDQVIKVAGVDNVDGIVPGTIIWRLGGKESTFTLDAEAGFERQHHATSIRSTHDEEDILLFDNKRIGASLPSRAVLLRINKQTSRVSLVSEFIQPDELQAEGEGSVEKLLNGNVFVGWGQIPQASEYSDNGTLLLHLEFSPPIDAEDWHSYAHSYRSFKFSWTSSPKWAPKLLAYRQDCDSPLFAYASWNGATEVYSWRFSISTDTDGQGWSEVLTTRRTGFETSVNFKIDHDNFAHWVSVEPLDISGNVLFERVAKEIWLPGPRSQILDTQSQCGLEGCANLSTALARFTYPDSLKSDIKCARPERIYRGWHFGKIFFLILVATVGLIIGRRVLGKVSRDSDLRSLRQAWEHVRGTRGYSYHILSQWNEVRKGGTVDDP